MIWSYDAQLMLLVYKLLLLVFRVNAARLLEEFMLTEKRSKTYQRKNKDFLKIKIAYTTAKVTTINGEAQLHARVDGKKIIITESTMRRDLQLEDAEGVDCLPNATIFKQLILMRPKTTAWNEFSSTMAYAIICLATNQKFNFSKLFFESIMKNLDNVSSKFLMYPRKPKKNTKVPQPSGSTDNVADKVVYKELDDSLVRAATITSSLEAEQDSGGGPKRQETMGIQLLKLEFCTKLQQRVLDLENTKTAQAQEITSLKIRVKKLEKKGGLRNHKLKRIYKVGRSARVISSDETSLGDQEDASNQGRKIDGIDKDAKITLDMAEKDINVAEKEVSTADPVTTTGDVVTTASVEISTASPTETIITDDMTLAQTLIEIRRTGGRLVRKWQADERCKKVQRSRGDDDKET
ncbi:hypothetical protein Tco_0109455 [Tanacetum coccineum]